MASDSRPSTVVDIIRLVLDSARVCTSDYADRCASLGQPELTARLMTTSDTLRIGADLLRVTFGPPAPKPPAAPSPTDRGLLLMLDTLAGSVLCCANDVRRDQLGPLSLSGRLTELARLLHEVRNEIESSQTPQRTPAAGDDILGSPA